MRHASRTSHGAFRVSLLTLAVACGTNAPTAPKTAQDESERVPPRSGSAASAEHAPEPVGSARPGDAGAAQPGAATAALRIVHLVEGEALFPLACWDLAGSSWHTPATCVAALEAAGTVQLGNERYAIVETLENTDETTGIERFGVELDRAGPNAVYALSGIAGAGLVADFGHTRREHAPTAAAALPAEQRRAVAKAVGFDADALTFLQAESADIDGDGASETLVSVHAATGGDEELGLDTKGFIVAVADGPVPTVTRLHAATGARLRILGTFDVNQDDTAEIWIYRIRDEYEDEVIATIVAGKPKVIGSYCCHR